MKKLAEISTHKAIKENGVIKIIAKGLDLDDLRFPDEVIDTLPGDHEDDVFAIMEILEENNRINVAEFMAEMSS
jgi:hypothetical protein